MLLSMWFGCTVEPPIPTEERNVQVAEQAPDILLITIDTLRADRLGVYGDTKAQTPNLDRLAKEGMLFTESHSVTPLTLPSHSSMLTGLWPSEHGVRDNAGFWLDPQYQTIAESLSDAGYTTGAFVSAFVLSHSWGLDQGFDFYHDPFHPQDLLEVAAFGEAQLPAGEVLNVATQWWRKQDLSTPKFAWVHLYDPHTPWDPPANWKGDPYRGEIAKVDYLLGNLLELASDAWVIVTSDHGEGLWEHGEREHGVLLGRAVTRVPLIIRPPKGLAGGMTVPQPDVITSIERPSGVDTDLDLEPIEGDIVAAKIIEQPVSGVDIAPTIAEIAKVDFQSSGESVLSESRREFAYAETYFPYFHYGWHPLSMIQNSNQRIENGQFTTSQHPTSQENIAPNTNLLERLVIIRGSVVPDVQQKSLSAAEELALQSLGYQTEFVFPSVEEALDPRETIQVLQAVYQAEHLPIEQAIPALEKIVEQNPKLLDVHLSLAYLESKQGNFESALSHCVDVLRQNTEHSVALNNAVILANTLKKTDVAEAFAEKMLVVNPQDVRAYRYLTAIAADREDRQQVIDIAAKGLLVEPNDPNLNYLKGLAHAFQQEDTQAIIHLQKAKENDSRANDISLWLGIASERLGKLEQALKHYEQARSDMPLDPRPTAKAALMLVEAKRCSEAMPLLVNVAKRLSGPEASIEKAIATCQSVGRE